MKAPSVLVINPPLLLDQGFIDYPFFAGLGALSNAAALRAAGCSVRVADAQSLAGSSAWPQGDGAVLVGCDAQRLLDGCAGSFEAVVVSLPPYLKPHAPTRFTAGLFRAVRARFPAARVIAADCFFGGMHYIEYDSEGFLRAHPGVSAVARYETENVLASLLEAGGARSAAGRAATLAPDDLAPPAWELIDVARYYGFQRRFFAVLGRPGPFGDGTPTLPALTSRGCAFRCGFCTSNPGQGKPSFRPHGLDYLRRHFGELKRRHGARRLALLDGCANHDPERFDAVLDLLASLSLTCEFPNGLRADKLSLRTLKRLKALAGSVTVSAESADREMLAKTIGKGLKIESIERVAAWCRELRLPLDIHYVVGCPGETTESANKTLLHAARMKEEHGAAPLVQNFVPIPGAPLHGVCAREGLLGGFDAGDLYSYFQGRPAVETKALDAEKLSRMTALLRRRLACGKTEKLIINLTYHCSNACRFCAVGDKPKRHGDFKRHLALLREYRGRGVSALDLDGGEPTLYPHLFALVRLARRMGYARITVTSNGRRLADRAYAARLLLCGIDDLLISLHGHTAALHDFQTRRPGSFGETVAGIRNAARLRPRRVGLAVNTVLTAENAACASEFLGFVHGLGVEKVNVQFVTPFGRAADAPAADQEELCRPLAAAVKRWDGKVRVDLVNGLPCRVGRHFPGAVPELGKLSRDMAFVDAAPSNLAAYLDAKRVKTDECRSCEFSVGCAGFHAFGSRAA